MQTRRISLALPFVGSSLLLVAILGYFLTVGHDAAIRSAERMGHNEAHILASRVGAILHHAASDLDYIAQEIAPDLLAASADGSSPRPVNALDILKRAFPEIQGYFITDADGRRVHGSVTADTDRCLQDHAFLQGIGRATDTRMRYSEALACKPTDSLALIVHRAVFDPAGRFAGVVFAPIDLDRIAELFSRLELGPRGVASIRRTDDSRLVVRWPVNLAEINQPAHQTAPYQRITRGEREGATRNAGKVDGVERIFNFKVLDDHPFYVLVGRDVGQVLAHWRLTATLTILLSLGAFALIALMVVRLQQRTSALQTREAIMSAIVDQASDAIELTDLESMRFVEFNDASCGLLGYTREEYARLRVHDINAVMSAEALADLNTRLNPGDSLSFETLHRRKDGELIDVQVSLRCLLLDGRLHAAAVWRDISERRRREQLLALHHELASLVRPGDPQQLSRKALDAAESMTRSRTACLHFIEADQQTVLLQVWSSSTLARIGPAGERDACSLSADCIRQRRAVIHNDCTTLPDRKAEGRAGRLREAIVPLIREGRVVLLIGVGDKPTDYTDADVALLSEIAGMLFDFVERQRAEAQLEFMAYHDTLTGLPNQMLILDLLRQAIGQARRSQSLVVVGYINLDGFRPLNEHHGYAIGDRILLGVASRLNDTLRQGDALARIGGDEFVVLLSGLSNTEECNRAMQRIFDELNQPIEVNGEPIEIQGSIGATFFPLDDAGPDALLHHAHQAMFQAKRTGRASYRLYDPVREQQLRERHRIRDELAVALESGQLVLFYQPKISLTDGHVVGVEALVRWQHPERGLLQPALFLPQIEGLPLDIQLGEWVLQSAVRQLNGWLTAGIRLMVSVNISPQHLQSPGFKSFLESLLASYPPETARHLELEILEVAGIDDADKTSEVMHACKTLGIQFSLDDFGTGYSSLTHFHNLPIDVVKIDQNFVRSMLDRPSDRDIVQGVLRLADYLERPVVAEGVENIEIGLLLLDLGCPYAQGYGIARPMPAEQLPIWLQNWNASSHWHQLGHQIAIGSRDPDLDVAIFSHRNWREQLLHWLHDDAEAVLPELAAEHSTFRHWYHGLGQKRYGHRPGYTQILPKHDQLHGLARQLVATVQAGHPADALARLPELDRLSNELLALLATLPESQEADGATVAH